MEKDELKELKNRIECKYTLAEDPSRTDTLVLNLIKDHIELQKNDGDLFCKIMVEAIAGLADAAIVKQGQYSGFHSLKYVKMLREKAERLEEENKKLLNDFMHISKMFTEALKLCHRVMKIGRGDDDADTEGVHQPRSDR